MLLSTWFQITPPDSKYVPVQQKVVCQAFIRCDGHRHCSLLGDGLGLQRLAVQGRTAWGPLTSWIQAQRYHGRGDKNSLSVCVKSFILYIQSISSLVSVRLLVLLCPSVSSAFTLSVWSVCPFALFFARPSKKLFRVRPSQLPSLSSSDVHPVPSFFPLSARLP